MGSKFLNISTDNTLGGNGASNSAVPSQKAVKDYIDTNFANNDLSNLTSDGKSLIAIKGYNNQTTYSLNEVVMTIDANDEVKLYKSLVNNNTSSLTDTTKWEETSFGGSNYTAGTGIDITNNVISTVALVITDYTA